VLHFHHGFFYLLCIKHFYCFYKVRGCVVNLVGHGSCIMGHGSLPVTHCLLWNGVRERESSSVRAP